MVDTELDAPYWVSLMDAYLAGLLPQVLEFENQLAVAGGIDTFNLVQLNKFFECQDQIQAAGGKIQQWTKQNPISIAGLQRILRRAQEQEGNFIF